MDKINYFSVECWGGATFDSCIRFLDEDPWERLRILRKELPHQKLQMLFRGQNMLGYRPYADDAVEYFVQKSVANGIDVIRIFDALNDPRNLQTAIKAANKEGAHVQGCISYTLSPVHTNEAFAKYAKTLEEMGADSICIKDMAGLLTPFTCAELVKELKAAVKIPVDIHSHYTAGLASMSIIKGIEAGADIVDTAMSPLALGTSHMPTESLVAALQGTDYDTGLDLNQLNVVRVYFAKLREKYIANGQISPKSLGVDANTLIYQVPGGMFSNMLKQLKDAGKEDKLDEVLAEIPRVREDAGYPPLVTPTSQIVGTQAVFNVILGERYKMVTKEFKGLVHGDYGKTPGPHQPRVYQEDSGGRPAHHLPLCGHPGPRDGQTEGRGRQVGHPGRGRPDLRHVPPGGPQVLREAQRQDPGRRRRPRRLRQQVPTPFKLALPGGTHFCLHAQDRNSFPGSVLSCA